MKILFISTLNEKDLTGGAACSRRNLDSVIEIYGKDHVETYYLKPPKETAGLMGFVLKIIRKIYEIYSLYMLGINDRKLEEIYRIIAECKIRLVFLDSSNLGVLSKKIKQRFHEVETVTFFHNVEYVFAKEYLNVTKNFARIVGVYLSYRNERCACRFSDIKLVLNERDAGILKKIYGYEINGVVPISFVDKYKEDTEADEKTDFKKIGFIGSYFFPNVEGIKWFVSNVFPYLKDVKLIIAGMRMDRLRRELPASENIEILSDLPDLQKVYRSVDMMIMPIFSGSGMKVKTAEALMYGKFILGTEEAFQGYDINDECGIKCMTANEFIDGIARTNKNKFNLPSRKIFEEKYSFEATLKLFQKHLIKSE